MNSARAPRGGTAHELAPILGPLVYVLVRLARYARLYQKRGPKILIERYYLLLCSKQHRIDVLS